MGYELRITDYKLRFTYIIPQKLTNKKPALPHFVKYEARQDGCYRFYFLFSGVQTFGRDKTHNFRNNFAFSHSDKQNCPGGVAENRT